MDLLAILNFFDHSVPIGVLFMVVYLVRMGRDINHLNEKLDNHITDTNKKTDHLSNQVQVQITNTNKKIDHLGDKFHAQITDIHKKIDENSAAIHKKIDENNTAIHKKIDRLGDRFAGLYEILLKDKQLKSG